MVRWGAGDERAEATGIVPFAEGDFSGKPPAVTAAFLRQAAEGSRMMVWRSSR
jgi:hypothetical protein